MNGQGVPSLSFIPATDAVGYVKTFHTSGSINGRISGDAARSVLMQSRLPVSDLGRIWELSDMNKTGSLSLPEFMLAMFLAQSRIRGKALPEMLPVKIAAEVQVANNNNSAGSNQQQQMQMPVPMQQQQQQRQAAPFQPPVQQMQMPTSMSLGMNPGMGSNMSMPVPASSVISSVSISQMHQQTPTMGMPTPTHYNNAAQRMVSPTDPSGPDAMLDFEASFPSLSPHGTSIQGALTSVKQSFGQNLLGSRIGESQHQWVIAAGEKAQYEAIFRRWDPGHRGVLKGEQAREVFAQSGLAQTELAKVWSLADINNQGELNLDEFSVAMHLIFRRLAGAPIPDVLPAELVPRSSKDFMDSLLNMKEQLLFGETVSSKPKPASANIFASRLDAQSNNNKSSSSLGNSIGNISDNEDDYVYTSSNRRKNTPAATPVATAARTPVSAQSVEELKRTVEQRRAEVQRMRDDAERRKKERAEGRVTSRWRIDDLKREIEDIHRTTPMANADPAATGSGEREKLLLKRRNIVSSINDLVYRLPDLAKDYEKLSAELADTKRDVVRLRSSKSKTGSTTDMESRAARLVAQRMAALTGESFEDLDSDESNVRDQVAEIEKSLVTRKERVDTVSSSIRHVEKAMRDLRIGGVSAAHASDARKWEDGVGVGNEEVRELIDRLRRIERLSVEPVAQAAGGANNLRASAFSPVNKAGDSASGDSNPASQQQPAADSKPSGPSIAERLAQARTKQERDQILQEMAEERFRERQRALGLPETTEKETTQHHHETNHETAKPEMQQRASERSNPFAAVRSTENTQTKDPVSDDDDNDDDDVWDQDESSDDDDLPDLSADKDPFLFGEPASPKSSVSFNTAFAQPAADSNPFASLLSAGNDNNNNNNAEDSENASVPSPPPYEKLRLRALYPYRPDTSAVGELSIETGVLIETRPVTRNLQSYSSHTDEGWMYGEILKESLNDEGDGWQPSGVTGWFPKDYTETLGAPGSRGWNKTKAMFGTAKYAYEPQHEDELRIAEGDRVRVIDGDTAESWWKVRIINGTSNSKAEEGMLPAMYIDLDK
ncbi:actin organization and endocytosis protein [Coemansia sp. IMI 203386]|nr:actin organization and endocytosis protein [Coemansia sp. IMI 203386]